MNKTNFVLEFCSAGCIVCLLTLLPMKHQITFLTKSGNEFLCRSFPHAVLLEKGYHQAGIGGSIRLRQPDTLAPICPFEEARIINGMAAEYEAKEAA